MAGIIRKCRACNRPVKGHQGPVGEKRCTNPRLGEEEQEDAVDGAGEASTTSKAKTLDEVEVETAAVATTLDASDSTVAVELDENILKENVVRKLTKKTKGKKAKVAEAVSDDEPVVSRKDIVRVEAAKEDGQLEDEPMEKRRKKKVAARIEQSETEVDGGKPNSGCGADQDDQLGSTSAGTVNKDGMSEQSDNEDEVSSEEEVKLRHAKETKAILMIAKNLELEEEAEETDENISIENDDAQNKSDPEMANLPDCSLEENFVENFSLRKNGGRKIRVESQSDYDIDVRRLLEGNAFVICFCDNTDCKCESETPQFPTELELGHLGVITDFISNPYPAGVASEKTESEAEKLPLHVSLLKSGWNSKSKNKIKLKVEAKDEWIKSSNGEFIITACRVVEKIVGGKMNGRKEIGTQLEGSLSIRMKSKISYVKKGYKEEVVVDTKEFNLFKIDPEDEDLAENDTSEESMDENEKSRILSPTPPKEQIEADVLKTKQESVEEEENSEEQDEGTDEEDSDEVEKEVNSDESIDDDENSEAE